MARRACTLLVAFATLVVAVALVLGAAKPANAQTFEQVAPELAQPDKVKTSSADAADAAAAKAAAAAALDRSLPVCATVETATTKPGKNNSNKSAACSLVRPVANDTADDPAWSQFEAAYAGTVWLPPTPAASKMHIRAAASYYQVRWKERERGREREITPVVVAATAAAAAAAAVFPFFASSFLSRSLFHTHSQQRQQQQQQK